MTAQSKYHDLLGRTGVNTRTVARETNIPYSTLNEWRKGKTKKISMENLTKLANFFGVSVTYFYDDEDLTDEQKITLRKIHDLSPIIRYYTLLPISPSYSAKVVKKWLNFSHKIEKTPESPGPSPLAERSYDYEHIILF